MTTKIIHTSPIKLPDGKKSFRIEETSTPIFKTILNAEFEIDLKIKPEKTLLTYDLENYG